MSDAVRCSLSTSVADVVVTSLEVDESVDRPYVARIRVEIADPDIDAAALLAQDVEVVWERDAYARRLCGLVRGIREVSRGETHTGFELDVAPALALLGLTRNTRMFQEQTVPQILETVLGEKLGAYGRQARQELTAEYPRREYCLQYQESDLHFVQRLMEEEGISYAFDHEGSTEVMVLRDSNDSYAKIAGAKDPVEYSTRDAGEGLGEKVLRFVRLHGSAVTAVTLNDFDWTAPSTPVGAEVPGQDVRGRTRESYEHGQGRSATIGDYDQGAKRYKEHDPDRQKGVRIEAHTARDVVGHGSGRVIGLVPGGTFSLTGHPSVGVEGDYLITRVTHRAAPGATSGARHSGYTNTFECVPLETPHRPRRLVAKPRIPSIQTAVVTGPAGEEIHTDEHARIKVQFHWDRENAADENSSCWVRVQQKWAGDGWGFVWIPRIGMEVVVQFVDGDPDRPLVTGCVYDGSHLTPYELPGDKTKSTIKSNSTPGGGGFNELRFEDLKGQEEIYTHAQKDQNEVVENDHTTWVGHDQTIQVDNDQTQTVHANQTEEVGANQSLTVDGNRSVHVESDFCETVDGTETRTVTGDVTEDFDASETRDIAVSVTETIGGDEKRMISGSQTETIGANHAVTITGSSTETIAAALDETITGGITTTTAGNWAVTAAGGFNVTAAGGITVTATGGLTIASPGGVQQVDSFLTWAGTHKAENGAVRRSFTPAKYESFGVNIGFTTQKYALGGATLPNIGCAFTIGTDDDGKYGCKMDIMAAEAHKWGADIDN